MATLIAKLMQGLIISIFMSLALKFQNHSMIWWNSYKDSWSNEIM